MVKVSLKGKYYCLSECEYTTKTGLCSIRDKSCIYLEYKSILTILD
ncbi:hypothetical protein LCGC14_1544580 [marine sediment metagenome]|uniref:Uncharacterized protein n=1 Tax=marine sediment metagenome TaxID=412755 RepID=A0A0F9L864_9ZZZZ